MSPLGPLSLLQNPKPYEGPIDVDFEEKDDGKLSVYIETEDLHGEYVQEGQVEDYVELFGDPVVMEKYGDGKTKTREYTENRVQNSWMKRWREEKNPYTAIAFSKNDTDEFATHVVAGGGDNPGQSELAYFTKKTLWEKGYTKQAVTAVVHEYLPKAINGGYLIEGNKLKEVVLTARPDNPGSVRLAVDIGMKKYKEEEKYGALRWHFQIQAEELRGMLENKV